MTTPSGRRPKHLSSSPFKPAAEPVVEVFEVGDRVTHDRCGLGRVVGVEPGLAVQVEFASQTVRVLSPFRELTKL